MGFSNLDWNILYWIFLNTVYDLLNLYKPPFFIIIINNSRISSHLIKPTLNTGFSYELDLFLLLYFTYQTMLEHHKLK